MNSDTILAILAENNGRITLHAMNEKFDFLNKITDVSTFTNKLIRWGFRVDFYTFSPHGIVVSL